MKSKRKSTILTMSIALFAMCFCIGLVAAFQSEPTTANAAAATTPRYAIPITYTTWYSSNGGKSTTGSGTATSFSARIGQFASSTYSVSLYGSAASGTGTWNGYIKSSTVTIVLSSSTGNPTLLIADSSGKGVGSGTNTITLTGLTDGTYTASFGESNGWVVNARQYDSAGFNAHFTFTVDQSAPTISGAAKGVMGKCVNASTYVSATDSGSGVQSLYMKKPNSNAYTAVGTAVTVNPSDGDGLYYFYAKDNLGNTSSTHYLYLDTVKPTGNIVNESGKTVTTATNKSFRYIASDTGTGVSEMQYQKPGSSSWMTYDGSLISATDGNGTYSFRCFDIAGNESGTETIKLDTTKPSGTLYGGTKTISSGGRTNAEYIKFYARDMLSGLKYILVRTPNATKYVTYKNNSHLTEEGTYYFYCVDKAGNVSKTYEITLDRTAPTLGCLQTKFFTTYGRGFTVSASDNYGGRARLYYKTPSDTAFKTSAITSYTTTLESEDGKYYFYAVDDLGNTSETYWIELKIVYPDPTIVHDDTGNAVYVTWTNGVSAELNGENYEKGTWIREEGDYTVTVTNEYGLCTTKTFTIGHNYVFIETIEPTCTDDGYTVYKCTSCGDEYITNVKNAIGHNYDKEIVNATCTTYGCVRYTCLNCGDCYETDKQTALGHRYTETTRAATCTEDGGQLHTCTVCGYEYLTDIIKATGHDYATRVIQEPRCETTGVRVFCCEKCSDECSADIPATGHNYELTGTEEVNGENIRTYVCTNCGAITTQNMGEQYEQVSSYIGYLFGQYQPYMWWVLLATAGVWSIVMGVFFAIAQKNEDKEKARKMIKNYVIGLVVIFVILVACPYLVKGIAALIAG